VSDFVSEDGREGRREGERREEGEKNVRISEGAEET
jgi:hypothetical protein